MKNKIAKIIQMSVIITLITFKVAAQNNTSETDMIFDSFGNRYLLSNLSTSSSKPIGGGNSYTISATTQFCTAGYYDLFYESGSFFDGNTNAQNVACEVFRNLSGLIYSPLTGTNTVKIYLRDMATTTVIPPPLGQGSPFYVVPNPNQPANTNPGIVENQVYKTIISGVDAYANLPSSMYVNVSPTTFYHGFISINPTVQWYTGIGTSTVANDYDLYSVLLHEAIHVLGFSTLISSNGTSVFGQTLNYYSSYDKFLHNAAGIPLITSSTQATCPNSNNAFTLSASNIAPGSCPSTITNSTTCTSAAYYASTNTGTVAVYTPNCFESGSSLCHFEDLCTVPSSFTATSSCYSAAGNSNNDLYWTMSNANGTGSCYVKRYPKPIERLVLCDLGYNVNTTYTSNAAAATFTYGGSACPGKNIWGVNDGFNGSIYTFTTTASAISIATTVIAANDASTTVQLSCLDVIYNNATATISGGNMVVTANTGYHGLVLVKYLPENASGQQGNPTYVYIYFVPTGCSPSGMCNLIQNGGFESVVYGPGCNPLIGGSTNLPLVGYSSLPGCWESYEGVPDIFERNCTTTLSALYNLGINTLGTTINSYNGSPNNHIVGLSISNQGFVNIATNIVTPPTTESLKNNLASPLIPGQTYQVSFLVSNYSGTLTGYNNNSLPAYVNINAQPIVITLASAPVYNAPTIGGFPSGLNTLAQFTIAASTTTASPWTAITQTFVFTPTVSHSAFIIGSNAGLTFPTTSTLNTAYCFIDEVSIQAVPNPTFTIPNALNCGNATYTNLIQYASGTGTFTGANVTFSNPQYNFNTAQSLSSGTYPVAYSSSNGTCVNTVWQNVKVSVPYTLSVNTNTINCANFNTSFTLNASSSPSWSWLNYTWQPGNLSGSNQVITQTTTAIYTLTSTDPAGCTASATLAIVVPTNCCNSVDPTNPSASVFTATTVTTGTSITGPMFIASDFTIQPGASFVFMPGEYIFTQNARIVVSNSASVWMAGAHLYSCGADLWQGIVVKDGGQVIAFAQNGNDNLIEDAITAIDASSQATASGNVLTISNTIFNKNRTDLKLGNYNSSSANYASVFGINTCVFTCRDFSFTGTSWPSVSTTSTGLRYANPSITGLATPYELMNAPIVNLKNPYSNARSQLAIQINSLGITTGVSYPTAFIGFSLAPSGQSNFLLFDAHENFIDALNSNVKINNCVFQNTQTFSVAPTPSATPVLTVGAAINHVTSIVHNFQLDLSATSSSVGNKFYDCHRAITGDNIFDFRVQNAMFRSTQSSSLLSTNGFSSTGQQAIFVNTKQADNYSITSNEFTNIQDAVTFNFYGGPVNANMQIPYGSWSVWPQTTYIGKISINNNTFSPELSTTFSNITSRYMRNAVVLTSPYTHYMYTACGCNSVSVNDNVMYRVYNGVRMDGLNTYTMSCRNSGLGKAIANNTITLDEDFNSTNTQRAIQFTNSQSYPTTHGQKVQTIERNILKVYSGVSNALTNTKINLMYLQENGAITGTGTAYPTPHILCNDLSNAYKGFAFVGWNKPSNWRGNAMQDLPLAMGLYTAGIIGQQGNPSSPIDNTWNGSGWGTYTTTYADGTSNAGPSPLFVQSGSMPYYPSNNLSFNIGQSYNQPGGITIATSGTFSCSGSNYTLINVAPPSPTIYPTDVLLYIANTFAYRFLSINDSLKNADGSLLEFYNNFNGTSIDLFTQVELKINEGNYSDAESILGGMWSDSFNQVEINYYNFYTIYLKYQQGEYPLTPDDIAGLKGIADLCPGDNGSAVYQARSLFQLATGQVYSGPDGCEAAGARMAHNEGAAGKPKSNTWGVNIFPNPASNQLTIVGKTESENLKVVIRDLSSRVVLKSDLKTSNYFINLDLNLLNGAYFIKITNANNEVVTKKLLIAR